MPSEFATRKEIVDQRLKGPGWDVSVRSQVVEELFLGADNGGGLIFGLFHGLGLATKLQEFQLSKNGLVVNIVSFNVGIEIGQLLALTAVLIALSYWRTRPGYMSYAFMTNTVLIAGGFLLMGYQVAGHFLAARA